MDIMKKIQRKAQDNDKERAVSIAFLGDSVTQGCFEIYPEGERIGVVYDIEHAYHSYFRKILSVLYPSVPVNIINAGVNGNSAPSGLERLERDVLCYHPDLVIVCFGLNDSAGGLEGVARYRQALSEIFTRVKEAGCEILFMTPNMMNMYTSRFLAEGRCREAAERLGEIQRSGIMDIYMDTARKTCEEYSIKVCDCYKKWKLMAENGVDTTALLSNYINHPTREMCWLFAYSLVETMMQEF